MKFIGLKDNIISGVLIANRFSQPRGNLPILSNIYLQSKKTGLVIKATNLESGVMMEVRGMCEEEGDFTVNAKLLSDYLLSVPEEKIELEVKDGKLKISANKYQTTINGIEAVDFPILPEIEDGEIFEIEAKNLQKAIFKTIFAASAQEMRQELSGLYFSFGKNNILTIAATDSFRLAEQKIPFLGAGEKNAIIPYKTAQEVLKICEAAHDKKITVIFGQGEAVFKIDQIKVFSRLIEAQYPEYSAIIPQQINTEIHLKTGEFSQAVKTASLFSQNGLFDIYFKADPEKNSIAISSKRSDVGEHATALEASIKGEPVETILNYRYLMDCLSKIQEKEIEILAASGSQPIKLRATGDNDYLYLIMPIRQ